jgi:hypothetical protein
MSEMIDPFDCRHPKLYAYDEAVCCKGCDRMWHDEDARRMWWADDLPTRKRVIIDGPEPKRPAAESVPSPPADAPFSQTWSEKEQRMIPDAPAPSADEQAVIAGLERVRAFVRSWWNIAGCQCDGVKHCSCPLCDVDRALALLRARVQGNTPETPDGIPGGDSAPRPGSPA